MNRSGTGTALKAEGGRQATVMGIVPSIFRTGVFAMSQEGASKRNRRIGTGIAGLCGLDAKTLDQIAAEIREESRKSAKELGITNKTYKDTP